MKNIIYNTSTKTKSQIREESKDAVADFLKRGGVITEVKPSRRGTRSKMAAKNSRGFQGGTSGFATGYPRRSMA